MFTGKTTYFFQHLVKQGKHNMTLPDIIESAKSTWQSYNRWILTINHRSYALFFQRKQITSTPSRELDPKTFWLLVSTSLSHLCKISRPYLKPVWNYWIWTKSTPQKVTFFWSNPYKTEVVITSFSFVGDVMDRKYHVITLITFILRRPRVSNFADIMEIAIMLNKKIFKRLRKS